MFARVFSFLIQGRQVEGQLEVGFLGAVIAMGIVGKVERNLRGQRFQESAPGNLFKSMLLASTLIGHINGQVIPFEGDLVNFSSVIRITINWPFVISNYNRIFSARG